ncbi:restriction endonuclease subunit S [Lacticaseibacillus paracasei]|uniref:restriction endonuclease subunit S n=1 Tax=Lacticaseibacillus paracasei TaxID=1597 RepID=UPI00034388F0|nr:restriction endonuclease subunit S [Lacticaseibacillus paracasei]EPC21962.1 Type I restriction-modification system, specificity subunit S [Lacticaseibacillus paracasei subsp. paracasei Lpp17]
MNAEQHVPPFRFKGFSDFWEQRKLSDLAMFNPRLELPDSFQYVDLESVSGTELINHRTETKSSAPSRAQRLAKKGDIFYQTVRPYQKNNYLYEKSDDDYVFSTGYAQLRPYEDGYFLFSRLQENGFVSTVLDHSTGTSYPAINSNDLAKLEIMVPLNLNEQQAIGKLFRHIDNAIALHQHKLAKLKELKKGYLQKLFPQNGETVPEFRFKGYSDAWEKRKLGELANIRRGASPRPIKSKKWFSQTSQVGWIRISDVTEQNGRIHQVEQHLSDAGQKKTLVLKSKHLLLSIAATVGKPVQNYIQVGVHDGFIVFMDPKFDLDFMFYFLEKYRPNWARFGQPGSQININSELVRDLVVSIPTVHEQDAVAQFIITLDNLIAATQCKLDLLKKLKKGYLQKMFC